MRNYIFLVEVKFEGEKRWKPTVGASLTELEARTEVKKWRVHNPSDKFRIAKYESCQEEAEK